MSKQLYQGRMIRVDRVEMGYRARFGWPGGIDGWYGVRSVLGIYGSAEEAEQAARDAIDMASVSRVCTQEDIEEVKQKG